MTTRTKPDRLVDEQAGSDERTFAVLMHLAVLANLVTGGVGIIVALVMWLIKRGESPYVDDHGRESLNFQISLLIYFVLSIAATALSCGLAAPLILGVYVLGLVGMIMAVLAANRGEYFRYPATIRFLH